MSKTSCITNKKLEEVESYWTKERRDSATPKPLPDHPGGDLPESMWPLSPIITPPNTSIEDEDMDERIDLRLADPVISPTLMPWKCNGKLFFTWKKKDYVGSAGAIFLEVLLTAGHNIFDEGEWSDNFYFYPSYPVGGKSFSWDRAAVFTAWQKRADFAFDYAMLLMNKKMDSSIGCVRDLPRKGRTWTAIGYPSEPPYPGNQMYKTVGDYVSGDSVITMSNNDMTKGSSGGSWLTTLKGKECVGGVQSTRGGAPSYANSPYIVGKDYDALLKCVKYGKCD